MASKFTINKEWRECSQCETFKIWACFDKQVTDVTWHRSACKLCRSSMNSDYRESTGKKNRSVIKHLEERNLKTDRWETPEPTSYELSWLADAIYIWTNPTPSLYEKMNKIGVQL